MIAGLSVSVTVSQMQYLPCSTSWLYSETSLNLSVLYKEDQLNSLPVKFQRVLMGII